MDSLLLLSLFPLIVVNIWHGILLAGRTKDHKPHTISEHAASSSRLLCVHRIMHTTASVILITFGFWYLLPHGYILAGWLIIAGGVFDILEVATLNKKSASEILAVNYHVVTAWAMALCYLLYASVIVTIAEFSTLLVIAIWAPFAVLLTTSVLRRFKDFWITQHIYFCLLALLILTAHVSLLLK